MSVVLAKELGTLLEGGKIVAVVVQLVNTNTVASNVSATVVVPKLTHVQYTLGVARLDTNNSGVVVDVVPPNSLAVTGISVVASGTTSVSVSVLGY